ncbi:MAG: ABC transporter substrate-binding protein [Hydrogenophaga sp.]|jgi:ABC-type branched-subunit amino acid transport system substrate-binding protein|uniref:ABC transporter substrate-binding protein n=1 Tax=Hydrogenophaga sp. TaxID=1904254 RepID=UPI000EBAD472|nr:ABC transporter substrate-binding protein [Hydrogenophaga sp.]MDD3783939.1 ABC transporter substrate-binding protein [Hydrogenophaga sp.]MDX9967686.1 ABC transporter substrate-binding protein [Hydrogenophaga sp.]HAJ14590.1 branched-chain amino acid ABC transporter substrate-binding protein [Comamonadaceae bacterium]
MRFWQGMLTLAMGVGAALAHAGDAGVTATEIRLGTSAVLTGPLGPQTIQYGEGARLLFDSINAKGGIHGRKITLTSLDDAFDVKRAADNTRRLVEDDKVFLLFNNTGTAHTGAVLPYLDEQKTILFGPVTGASQFRDRYIRHLFHVRASYANEADKIVTQLRQIGVTRVAAFYQDDAFGKALLDEVRRSSQKEGQPLVAEIALDPAKPDFAAAAAATAKASPQAVIICSAGTTFPQYVAAVQATSARPTFYGFSVATLDSITGALKDKARGIVLAQIMPSLRNKTIPVVREYLQALQAKDPNAIPSTAQFEGFVHARVLAEGLRRTGRDLSTESFIRTMETSGEISFGRFTARYTPQLHHGSDYVELAIIDASGQLRY